MNAPYLTYTLVSVAKNKPFCRNPNSILEFSFRPVTSAAALNRQIYLFTLLWPASADILSAG